MLGKHQVSTAEFQLLRLQRAIANDDVVKVQHALGYDMLSVQQLMRLIIQYDAVQVFKALIMWHHHAYDRRHLIGDIHVDWLGHVDVMYTEWLLYHLVALPGSRIEQLTSALVVSNKEEAKYFVGTVVGGECPPYVLGKLVKYELV